VICAECTLAERLRSSRTSQQLPPQAHTADGACATTLTSTTTNRRLSHRRPHTFKLQARTFFQTCIAYQTFTSCSLPRTQQRATVATLACPTQYSTCTRTHTNAQKVVLCTIVSNAKHNWFNDTMYYSADLCFSGPVSVPRPKNTVSLRFRATSWWLAMTTCTS
jgi:hypothetical protein